MISEQRFGPGAEGHRPDLAQDRLPRTALVVQLGQPRQLEAHLLRLQASAAMLGHPASWVAGLQRELCLWLQTTWPGGNAALRLVLQPAQGFCFARLEDLPVPPSPCHLVPMPHPLKEGRSDPAAPHKGLSGSWPATAMREAQRLGGDDALLLWPDGTLAETAIAAVGLERGDRFLLPPPEGRVASLAERLDLPAWAVARRLRISTAPISFEEAMEGRLWCMNALRGIWPATLRGSLPPGSASARKRGRLL